MNFMFCEIVENGISNADKLLICLAIILLLTIVWTILIGIMYKMREKTTVNKVNKFLIEDDDKVINKTTKKTKKKSTKRTTKKSTKKTTKRVSAATTNNTLRTNSNQEVYVKVRFYRTRKDLIYVAPENLILRKGDKIKVRTDEGSLRTATVVEGNYLREKYKTYEYQTLDVVE